MFDLTKPMDINWELNNICNLMCPQCARNKIKNGVLQLNQDDSGNAYNKLNDRDTSLKDFKIAFNNINNISTVRFYGHVSENVASKDFAKICEFILDKGSHVMVSTNGSLRTRDWWKKLGNIYKRDKESKVAFCLDGLREELSLYRINADYNKIMENAKAFIDAGGRAEWRMIVFKHNQHQIEEAKEIAKEYGFHNFTLILSNRLGNWSKPFTYKNKTYTLLPQDINKEWNEKERQRVEYIKSDELGEISCKFQVQNSIYVDYLLRVWPCCYLPNKKELVEKSSFYAKYYRNKSNNLLEKSLNNILYDNFYELLQMSWTEKSMCLKPCKSTCTTTHKSGNVVSSNYRERVW
jgi:MoaA/NifB/PqqE/SkfB family radical SAM enzyme